MTNPPAPSQPNAVSQASQGASNSVVTQRFDVSQLEIGPAAASNNEFSGANIFSPQRVVERESPPGVPMPAIGEATPVDAAEASVPLPTSVVVVAPARKERSNARFRFSNRRLLANLELFLQPQYRGLFLDRTEIVGQIKACARAATGNVYRVEWKRAGAIPLPASLNPTWLRETFPKEMEDTLKEAIARYDEVYPYVPGGATANVDVNVDGQRVVGTPPTMARGRGASAFRTASTIASHSISTLSRSTRSRTQVSPDDFDNMRDSDVEDGDDVDPEGAPLCIPRDYDNMSEDDEDYNTETTQPESDDDSSHGSLYDSDKDRDEPLVETVDSDDEADEPAIPLSELYKGLTFHFERVEKNTTIYDEAQPETYSGPTGMRAGVATQFDNPFECLGFVGGLSYDFIQRLAKNSNDYARKNLLQGDRNGRVHSQAWRLITTKEMHWFLGITLKISLMPRDAGGYPAYFREGNENILGLEIKDTGGFARKYMPLWRYKQIRSAFHPEPKYVGINSGDKAYQMRHAIETLNAAAARTYHVGGDLAFDEGSIGSRSRMNPIRQYNGSKPDKFRIDFFISAQVDHYGDTPLPWLWSR